jgi:hypothetical protein
MYKDIPRTQRVLVTTMQDVSAIKKISRFKCINQTTTDISAPSQHLMWQMKSRKSNRAVFCGDPLGHIMMSYPADSGRGIFVFPA